MITLIAESKTMAVDQEEIDSSQFHNNVPLFEEDAEKIMAEIRNLSVSEIAERLKISYALSVKAFHFAMEFPNKSKGFQALYGFTGEVFKALDPKTLNNEETDFLKNKMMIVSSLYGLLEPDTIIKPYRLEYKCDLGGEIGKLTQFWKRKNTIAFVKHLKEIGEKEILNLLPGDASDCLDWKLIKAFVKVEKPDFKIISDNATLKTPHSGRLKELRGLLLRHIAEKRINSFSSLYQIATAEFGLDLEHSRKGMPLILCND